MAENAPASLKLDEDDDDSQLLIEEAVAIMNNNSKVLYAREARLELMKDDASSIGGDSEDLRRRIKHKKNIFLANLKVTISVVACLVILIGVIVGIVVSHK